MNLIRNEMARLPACVEFFFRWVWDASFYSATGFSRIAGPKVCEFVELLLNFRAYSKLSVT